MTELDQLVFEEIRKLAMDPEFIHEARMERIKKLDTDKITILEKKIEQIDSQISRFMDLYGIGKFTIDQVSSKIDPLNEERSKLQKELDALTAETGELTEEEAIQVVNKFEEILAGEDFNEIRLTIETLINHIVIDNDDVYIHWNFL